MSLSRYEKSLPYVGPEVDERHRAECEEMEERAIDIEETTQDLAAVVRQMEKVTTAIEALGRPSYNNDYVSHAESCLKRAHEQLQRLERSNIQKLQRLQQERTAAHFGGAA